jgi:large subunit ribosomal protein L9
MEVILQENYPSLGYVGDRVSVKGGFARNFLIPRGLALEASSRNERLLKHKLQHVMAKRMRMRTEAEEFAKKLGGIVLSFTLKMSDGGKSFGAITSKDVEAAFSAAGHPVDRKQIKMTETLRRAGEFTVSVKLHAEVTAQVPVKIAAEVAEVKASRKDVDGEPKKGRGRKKAKDAAEASESVAKEKSAAEAE